MVVNSIARSSAIAGVLAATSPTLAQETATPRIEAARVDQTPLVDGKLDEEFWNGAAVLGQLKQMRPEDGQPVSEPTEILVAYDKDALYIGARLTDSRGLKAISANNMRQGSTLSDDDRLAILLTLPAVAAARTDSR